MPNALTKQAAARPLVSASMADGERHENRHLGLTGSPTPPSRDWKTSHSEANPFSGGSAEIAPRPIRKKKAVHGIRLIRPPISSMLRVPVACSTDPAPRNSRPLKHA